MEWELNTASSISANSVDHLIASSIAGLRRACWRFDNELQNDDEPRAAAAIYNIPWSPGRRFANVLTGSSVARWSKPAVGRCDRARGEANGERRRVVYGALAVWCAATERCATDRDARTAVRRSPGQRAFWPTSRRLAFSVDRVNVENLLEHSMSCLQYTGWCSDNRFLLFPTYYFFQIEFLKLFFSLYPWILQKLWPILTINLNRRLIYRRTRFSGFPRLDHNIIFTCRTFLSKFFPRIFFYNLTKLSSMMINCTTISRVPGLLINFKQQIAVKYAGTPRSHVVSRAKCWLSNQINIIIDRFFNNSSQNLVLNLYVDFRNVRIMYFCIHNVHRRSFPGHPNYLPRI